MIDHCPFSQSFPTLTHTLTKGTDVDSVRAEVEANQKVVRGPVSQGTDPVATPCEV